MSFGLNQYLTLGMAGITSKQISFSPGGRIIHICSRLRNPGSLLRATCSLQGRMQSKRLKYHHGAHFKMRKLRDLIKVTQLSMLNTRTNLGSVQFSRSVMSNSLRHRESQHAKHVHHQLPEFAQTHVHRVGDAIQRSHPLPSASPPAPNPSPHQGLFQ